MKVQELIEFGLFFDFLSYDKLSTYFKRKEVRYIPKYISGLDNFMTALDTHQKDLERYYFDNAATGGKKAQKKRKIKDTVSIFLCNLIL